MRLLDLAILTLNLSFSVLCFSQGDTSIYKSPSGRPSYRETAIKLLIGGNLQQAYKTNGEEYNRKYFEIGIHKTITDFHGVHGPGTFTHGFSLEVAPQSKPIYGFKYSAWVQAWCFVLGIGGIYYTDFDYGNFKIRPEFGIGMYPFKLTAGINIPTIHNKDFSEVQKAYGQVTLNILLKMKTLKKEY
jgi:hypothetical protein